MFGICRSGSTTSTNSTISAMEIKLVTSSDSQITCGAASFDSNPISGVAMNALDARSPVFDDLEVKFITSTDSKITCGAASSCIHPDAPSVVGTNGLGTLSSMSDEAEIKFIISSDSETASGVASPCNSPRACSIIEANDLNTTSSITNEVIAKFASLGLKSDASCDTKLNGNVKSYVSRDTKLVLDDFHFVQRLGSGDIGTVYLVELKGSTGCMFAAKMMDKEELAYRNKETRAGIEREILEILDHPFLPSLYATLDCPRWSCLLTEFCPGGDLHVLRQCQQEKRFDEVAVRFYASEVVAALEYLHMLGVVYRDLKPENVLVRSDGHIMLTDFDLSLKCDNSTSIAQLVYDQADSKTYHSSDDHNIDSERFSISSCILPSCIVPPVSCLRLGQRRKKKQSGYRGTLKIVAEPVDARSMSFVGTHEYLAPEIVSGEGHGNAVDWWTLGIFIYELFYGVTPFRGRENEFTLANIVARGLEFPKEPVVPPCAKDLISQLLNKDPTKRMGSLMGATAIKHHPFFEGVNWALLRCAKPPYIPRPFNPKGFVTSNHDHCDGNLDYY